MNSIYINLKKWLFESFKFEDAKIKKILIICLLLSCSVLISFWIKSFAIVTCVVYIICLFWIKGVD